MIYYKIDIFKELEKHGFTQARLKKENLLSQQTISNIRAGKSITMNTLNKLCLMTRLQPADIIEMKATDQEKVIYY